MLQGVEFIQIKWYLEAYYFDEICILYNSFEVN